eukprot:PITA_01635
MARQMSTGRNLWRQKSRIQWLKEGEQNTKFFHRSTLDYRGVNKILSLKNDQGECIENHQGIATLLTEHFNNIAQEPEIDRTEAIRNLIKSITEFISNEQNQALSREVSLEEVEEVVKEMPNDKASGLDGFTINFYKACWEIVKLEVWEVVEESRRSASILKSLNSTFLALIPKEEEDTTPTKFRPIGLCNVLYKIISKVIANRLKPILPGLISEEQSGYVEGRQILDNILLAQEMVHTLQSRKVAGMMMQLDLSKAYDKASWNYLEAILTAFGFASHWIRWIMALIKSTRFSILVNGAPTNQFTPSLGLRQGDPLSPFQFIILMEGLSRLIQQAKEEGKIKGLQPLPSIPATMHQQFVDDTMLHGSPTVKEAQGYKHILNLFSEASGNAAKRKWSLVAWNKLCKPKILGGLNLRDPCTINKACGAKLWWKWMKEPNLPWARHWKAKYAPSQSNQELIRMQESPEGSLIWNLAMKNRDIMQENSFWEICNGEIALFWEDAWQKHPKLEKLELVELQRKLQEKGMLTVHRYWSQANSDMAWRKWAKSEIENIGEWNTNAKNLNNILDKRKIRKAEDSDKLRWGNQGGGIFTLKEARLCIEKAEQVEKVAWSSKVWDSQSWPKIRTFLWLLMQRKTLTWENLQRKGFSGPSKCPLCNREEETMNHLFNNCDLVDTL